MSNCVFAKKIFNSFNQTVIRARSRVFRRSIGRFIFYRRSGLNFGVNCVYSYVASGKRVSFPCARITSLFRYCRSGDSRVCYGVGSGINRYAIRYEGYGVTVAVLSDLAEVPSR